MQQVKKQLQDAIAELKSGWGINEVKREDLAAVLEKVVAALDRAAALPLPDGGRDFDKHFFRVVVVGSDRYHVSESYCYEETFYPAIGLTVHPRMMGFTGFFAPTSGTLYKYDRQGRSFDDIAQGRTLYNRKVFFYLVEEEGEDSLVCMSLDGNEIYNQYAKENLDDPNWVF